MHRAAAILSTALLLNGCAASSKAFYASPAAVKDTTLCRTFFEAAEKGDEQFALDTSAEAIRRGLTLEECERKVATENGVLVAAAVVATAVGVGIACQNGCAGGGYTPPTYASTLVDYDCAGGGGDGPYYVQGPIRMTGPDVYGLDRDRDGIGCEPFDDWGS